VLVLLGLARSVLALLAGSELRRSVVALTSLARSVLVRSLLARSMLALVA
jgi:hypothetical protein